MTKLLLLAFLYLPLLLPLAAARTRSARRGLRRVVIGLVVIEVLTMTLLLLTHVPGSASA
jgi:hypothetical protein